MFGSVKGSLKRFFSIPFVDSGPEAYATMVHSFFDAACGTDFRDSIVVSISACHADDPGSIPGRGVFHIFFGLAAVPMRSV